MLEATVLRYFREVAHTGSLAAASETLGVAASAISRQMHILEEHFGTRLFARGARGMRLNADGRLLLEFLTKQSQEAQDFHQRFAKRLGDSRSQIRLVTVEGVLPYLIPQFAKAFQEACPKTKLLVEIAGSNTAADMVAGQQANLGLLFTLSPRGSLIELAFMSQPLCLIVAAGHPLTARTTCSMKDVARLPVVIPDNTFGIRQEVDRVTASAHISLELALETNSIALMRQIAATGCAVTFLPRHTVSDEIRAGTLVAIPLLEKRLAKTRISLVRSAKHPLSPYAQKAVEILRAIMAA